MTKTKGRAIKRRWLRRWTPRMRRTGFVEVFPDGTATVLGLMLSEGAASTVEYYEEQDRG